MKRNANEISKAVFDACLGDFIDTDQRIYSLQSQLIKALEFIECPPDGGWCQTANRQIKALAKISEPPDVEFSWDIDLSKTHDSPKAIIRAISQSLEDRYAWNVKSVDEFIAQHTN